MRHKGLMAFVATVVVTVGCVPALAAGVEPALSSGDTVTFLVPAGTPVTIGAVNTVAHVTGRVSGTTQAFGCVADLDAHPIQRIVLVDSGSGFPADQLDIVPEQSSGIRPGTQVRNLTLTNSCTALTTGTQYDKYVGTVQ